MSNLSLEEKINFISGTYRDPKIAAIDFDNTLFERSEEGYPEIGAPIEKNIDYVKEMQVKGWKTILWTCRDGEALEMALEACNNEDLFFDKVNDNLYEEDNNVLSRKIYASIYIDDKTLNPMEI
jgi:hydroxymethylpyrimidine pyrophosphatase-like HAD family hydrolase